MASSEEAKRQSIASVHDPMPGKGLTDGKTEQSATPASASLESELSNHELNALDAILSRASHSYVPSMEGLDGFLAALALSPHVIEAGEFLGGVCIEMKKSNNTCFKNTAEEIEFQYLAMRHLHHLLQIFDDKSRRYEPMLRKQEKRGSDWARGFVFQSYWDELYWDTLMMTDKSLEDPYREITELAWGVEVDYNSTIHDPEVELSNEQRENNVRKIGDTVNLLHQFTGVARENFKRRARELEELEKSGRRRTIKKPKQNAPCICESGKKFKNCCGPQWFV